MKVARNHHHISLSVKFEQYFIPNSKRHHTHKSYFPMVRAKVTQLF